MPFALEVPKKKNATAIFINLKYTSVFPQQKTAHEIMYVRSRQNLKNGRPPLGPSSKCNQILSDWTDACDDSAVITAPPPPPPNSHSACGNNRDDTGR